MRVTDGVVTGEKKLTFDAAGLTVGDHVVYLDFFDRNSNESQKPKLKRITLTVTVLA